MIVETTSLAEPAPIVSTLSVDRVLSHEVTVETIVTVVDALVAADTFTCRLEWLKQVVAADTLILSKAEPSRASGGMSAVG